MIRLSCLIILKIVFCLSLDHEVEEYMPEFLMVKEPTTNTQMVDTSLCIPIPQKSIVLSDQNGVNTCIFAAGSPDKPVL